MFLLLIIFLVSCSTNKGTVRTQVIKETKISEKNMIPRSLIGILNNSSITNLPQLKSTNVLKSYSEDYKESAILQDFPPSKLSKMQASEIFDKIPQKLITLYPTPNSEPTPEGEEEATIPEKPAISSEDLGAVMKALKFAILKDPTNMDLYVEFGMYVSSFRNTYQYPDGWDDGKEIQELIAYLIIKNKENSRAWQNLLEGYMSVANFSSEEVLAMYYEILDKSTDHRLRFKTYSALSRLYYDSGDGKNGEALSKRMKKDDPEIYYAPYIVIDRFNYYVAQLGDNQKGIALWEKEYGPVLMSKLTNAAVYYYTDQKGNEIRRTEVAPDHYLPDFTRPFGTYLGCLIRTGQKEKAMHLFENMKQLNHRKLKNKMDAWIKNTERILNEN